MKKDHNRVPARVDARPPSKGSNRTREGERPREPQLQTAGWRRGKLQEVLLETRNGLYKPDHFYGRGTRILKMFNIGRFNGSWVLDRVDLVELTAAEEAQYQLEPGDILINRVNSRELVGKCAVIDDSTAGAVFESKNIRLRLNTTVADPYWTAIWLNSTGCRCQTDRSLKQIIGQATLNRTDLDDIEIPLPPLPIQRRIATQIKAQLAEVARARTALQAQLETAKALPAASLRAVFGDAPSDWREVTLAEILTLRKDVVHPRDKPRGRATFVGLEHIESGTGTRLGSVELELSDLTGRKPRFFAGDIVYGYLRPYLNKVWLADFDGLCSVDQYVYSVDSHQTDAEFIAWYMRSAQYLARAPIGITPGQLPRIRTQEVAQVALSLPPLSTQRALAARLRSEMLAAKNLRTALEAKLATLDRLPAALLRQVFGEVAGAVEGTIDQ